jgi:dihydrofolate reductase
MRAMSFDRGGVINQYPAAGLVDELELHIVPLVLARGRTA